MKTWKSFMLGLLVLPLISTSQEYLGDDYQAVPTTLIEELSDHGDLLDMSGGYAVGDTVADFQVYNPEGESFRLSDLFEGDKHIFLCSGSNTCVRFFTTFNTDNEENEWWATRDYLTQHQDDFEFVFIYGIEAHPIDIENCASNCPAIPILAANGDSLYQHVYYQDRIDAVELWYDIANEDTLTYEFPYNMYMDNPSNEVYDKFFERPFGNLILDCNGVVVERGDWLNLWMEQEGGIAACDAILQTPFQQCIPECSQGSVDSDGDGICDELEEYYGSDPDDGCDPNGEDADMDGFCDQQEINLGWDWGDPCDPNNDDSDGDGLCDIIEELQGFDPFDACNPVISDACVLCSDGAQDTDGDGICDAQELEDGTDPENSCDPNGFDADGDGYCDTEEIINGTDPEDACDPDNTDSDMDGICDAQESVIGSDVNDPCDPNGDDMDGDGICDGEEIADGSDPEDPCDPDDTDSDGDGICDYQEILDGTDPFEANDTVGIYELEDLFKTYPNPFGEELIIESTEIIGNIELYDLSGRMVISKNITDQRTVLNTSDLGSGIYFLRISTEKGELTNRMLRR